MIAMASHIHCDGQSEDGHIQQHSRHSDSHLPTFHHMGDNLGENLHELFKVGDIDKIIYQVSCYLILGCGKLLGNAVEKNY